jgi:hypothetical protein
MTEHLSEADIPPETVQTLDEYTPLLILQTRTLLEIQRHLPFKQMTTDDYNDFMEWIKLLTEYKTSLTWTRRPFTAERQSYLLQRLQHLGNCQWTSWLLTPQCPPNWNYKPLTFVTEYSW